MSDKSTQTTEARVLAALRSLLMWRTCINANPAAYCAGLEGDPDGLAVALFSGPTWDEAEAAERAASS